MTRLLIALWLLLANGFCRADVITISDPSSADESALGSLNPTLSATVQHSAGKAMEIEVP